MSSPTYMKGNWIFVSKPSLGKYVFLTVRWRIPCLCFPQHSVLEVEIDCFEKTTEVNKKELKTNLEVVVVLEGKQP